MWALWVATSFQVLFYNLHWTNQLFGFIAIFLVSPLVYLLFLCSWNFLFIQLFLFSPFYTFSHFFLVSFGCSSSSFLIYLQSYSSIKTIITLYWKTSHLHPLVLFSAQDKKSLRVSSSLSHQSSQYQFPHHLILFSYCVLEVLVLTCHPSPKYCHWLCWLKPLLSRYLDQLQSIQSVLL